MQSNQNKGNNTKYQQKYFPNTNRSLKKANLAKSSKSEVNGNEQTDSIGEPYGRVYMSKETSIDLFVIDGSVDGVQLKFAVDTGATVSLMASNIALSCDFVILKSNLQIKSVNGDYLQVLGRTKVIPVRVADSCVLMSFLIVEQCECDILLGLDWFNLTDAGVFPKRKKVIFPESLDGCDLDADNVQKIVLFS